MRAPVRTAVAHTALLNRSRTLPLVSMVKFPKQVNVVVHSFIYLSLFAYVTVVDVFNATCAVWYCSDVSFFKLLPLKSMYMCLIILLSVIASYVHLISQLYQLACQYFIVSTDFTRVMLTF